MSDRAGLAWRPVEGATPEQVQMDVKDRLSCTPVSVKD